jgi:hypothetical protein
MSQKPYSLSVAGSQPPEKLPASAGDLALAPRKHSMSRWEWSAFGSLDYCYRSLEFTGSGTGVTSAPGIVQEDLDANETGLRAFSTSVTAGYSISTHFSVVSGLSVFSAGQERDRSQVALATSAGGSSGMYALNTSAGVLTGSGTQFDRAYFDNPDSSLLLNTASIYDSSERQEFCA